MTFRRFDYTGELGDTQLSAVVLAETGLILKKDEGGIDDVRRYIIDQIVDDTHEGVLTHMGFRHSIFAGEELILEHGADLLAAAQRSTIGDDINSIQM
jgi:hypothetical protein